jgi:hypothetical protein
MAYIARPLNCPPLYVKQLTSSNAVDVDATWNSDLNGVASAIKYVPQYFIVTSGTGNLVLNYAASGTVGTLAVVAASIGHRMPGGFYSIDATSSNGIVLTAVY